MKVRCLIVDDEPLAIKLIENHIAKFESLEVVATCNNAMKAFEILNSKTVDLLFLDIKMPAMTGIDFLKTLSQPPKTILTTAYRDYALESYDLDIVDYLLKPITFDRFFKAMERYFRENTSTRQASPVTVRVPEEAYIIVKSGNKHHKIAFHTISYIESLKDYIRIHTENGRIISKYKISEIEKKLEEASFIRVHRSYIVNTNKITAFTPYDIEIGKVEIPIGISYKKKVMSILNG